MIFYRQNSKIVTGIRVTRDSACGAYTCVYVYVCMCVYFIQGNAT